MRKTKAFRLLSEIIHEIVFCPTALPIQHSASRRSKVCLRFIGGHAFE